MDSTFDLDSPLETPNFNKEERRLQLAQEREDKRKAKAIAMQDRRYRNRERIKKEQQELAERKQPESKLMRLWEANWTALSDEEKARIEHLNRECLLLWMMMNDCLSNIDKKLEAAPFPNLTFIELQEYLLANPAATEYPALYISRLDAATLDSFADQIFVKYGRITRLPGVIWDEFCRRILDWSRNNPDQADAEVTAELAKIVCSNSPKVGAKDETPRQ